MSDKIIAYKAMDKNMQCRGKQYEVGKDGKSRRRLHQGKRLVHAQKW